jgi:HTH-type transcriptional regulator, competence development regulator
MLGEKLKALREAKGLLQRQAAATIQVDTAYMSKMEHNEKPVNRNHLKKLAKLYGVSEAELLPLWLAAKVLQVIKKQEYGKEALKLILKHLDNEDAKL